MDYLRSFFSFIFAVSVMYLLLDCEIKYKKNWYFLGIFASVVIGIDVFLLIHYGYTFFMKGYPLLVHLPVFFAFVFISSFKAIKVFFVLCTLIAISTSFSLVGLIASYFFDSSRTVVNIVSYILYIPIWLIIIKHIRPTFLYMMRNTDSKSWAGFCFIPLSYSIILYSYSRYNLDEVEIERVLMFAVLFFVLAFSAYYMIFRFFWLTREQLTLQSEQYLLMNQVAAAQLQFEALEESQEKIILYRHDMRHHLNLINSYLEDNNKDAAQKYITEVEESIENATIEKYCSNYTVNLILYFHIMHAKKEEIKVETHIILPEKNAVSDMALCIIFGNALENAINACKGVLNTNDRFIKIVCKNKNNKLFIQITNSYEGSVAFAEELPISTKENHGLGTRSIAAVAQKYGGMYSFTAENGVFTTSIIL
ncbi:MAG: GHKL domain-containing protein [Anaerotignum sp.]|nr:GHKL domain-containing protein [Anaerotignum sp.]